MADQANKRHGFLDERALVRLTGVGLSARHPMLGNVSGRHRSSVRGTSLEFAQYREYVPGDDPRRMDWRTWGRSDRYFIKEYEADTNLRLCLVVDTSGSLGFEIGGRAKLDVMKALAGSLAYVASRQGDAVGLYCAGKGFHTEIRPRRNATHLRLVLDQLSVLQAEGETGLAEALHQAAEKIRQRALVVVISDLYLDPGVLKGCFQHLRFRKHDVSVFHLLDQSEIDFGFDRPTRFVDLEGGESILADPERMANHYHRAMSRYLRDLQTVMRETGVDYHRANVQDRPVDVLSRFLIGRKPRKKGGR